MTKIYIFKSLKDFLESVIFSSPSKRFSWTFPPVIVKQFSGWLSKSSCSTIVLKRRDCWLEAWGGHGCMSFDFFSLQISKYLQRTLSNSLNTFGLLESIQSSDCPPACCQFRWVSQEGLHFYFLFFLFFV